MRSPKMVILVPSLLFAISAPAWSANSDEAASHSAQVTSANPYRNSLLGMLSSVLTDSDPSPRQPQGNCKASQLYSQHDVVGDHEACFQGHYNVETGSMFVPVTVP
jgi:hypothetical protein